METVTKNCNRRIVTRLWKVAVPMWRWAKPRGKVGMHFCGAGSSDRPGYPRTDSATIMQQGSRMRISFHQTHWRTLPMLPDNIASAADRRKSDEEGRGFVRDLALESIFQPIE